MFLDYFALGVLIFVVVTLFYAIIAIHDIPYDIARHRQHPHQDAIHVAGWVSLFTLHTIWPFLWIWAMLYRPDRGWGMLTHSGARPSGDSTLELAKISTLDLAKIEVRIARLEQHAPRGPAEQGAPVPTPEPVPVPGENR